MNNKKRSYTYDYILAGFIAVICCYYLYEVFIGIPRAIEAQQSRAKSEKISNENHPNYHCVQNCTVNNYISPQ